jgi:hypothetical protein
MNFLNRIWRSNFFIKLRHWEYWPFGVLQFPIFFYYLWLSLRARSFFFFSASNPGIEMGGMLGESKFSILQKIPETYRAKALFIPRGTTADALLHLIAANDFAFPLVFKPDLGERGYRVERIYSATEARNYVSTFYFDFIVQELVDLPLEFGVFYKRLPSESSGTVFSIVGKEMLTVTGDGKSSLRELILNKDRAKLQWEKLAQRHAPRLDTVIAKDESVVLNSIGNHCLGTLFLDNNCLINKKLTASFDRISKEIEGFYYGRFDLRCASVEDLNEGRVKIMELNGCGAEPAHIYQPGYSFWKAVGNMMDHWRSIFDVAVQNKERGTHYLTYKEVRLYYRKFKEAVG